jgi:hypothetical protein
MGELGKIINLGLSFAALRMTNDASLGWLGLDGDEEAGFFADFEDALGG